jgi:hypothetical protein
LSPEDAAEFTDFLKPMLAIDKVGYLRRVPFARAASTLR